MEDKSYVKISKQDYDIAESFFQNDKHLDEFISNVSRYYCGKNLTIKTKIVQRYFETYKKTMDFVINSRNFGKVGGVQRVNNQLVIKPTLEGCIEGVSKQPPNQIVNSKVISNNSKKVNNNLEEISKEILPSVPVVSEIKKVINSPHGDGELHYLCRVHATENEKKYPPDMYKEFLQYWTAIVTNGKLKKHNGKEKWRNEETFVLELRLSTWFKNYNKDAKNNNTNFGASKGLGATAVFSADKDYSGKS